MNLRTPAVEELKPGLPVFYLMLAGPNEWDRKMIGAKCFVRKVNAQRVSIRVETPTGQTHYRIVKASSLRVEAV